MTPWGNIHPPGTGGDEMGASLPVRPGPGRISERPRPGRSWRLVFLPAVFSARGSRSCVGCIKLYSYRSARTGDTAAADIPESMPAATKTTTEPTRIAESERALITGVSAARLAKNI